MASTPDWQNVLNFGADPSGNSSSTSAIANAILSAASTYTGVVYFPSGIYLTAGNMITANGITILGDGPGSSFIKSSSAGGNTITIGSQSAQTSRTAVKQVGFLTAQAQTGGAHIEVINAFSTTISDIYVASGFSGINVDSSMTVGQSICKINNFEIQGCAFGIQLGVLSPNVGVIDIHLSNGTIGPSNTGIVLQNASGIYANNIDIVGGVDGLLFDPSGKQSVNSCFFSQVLADSSSGVGWNLAGSSNLSEIILTACWGSSCKQNGLYVTNPTMNGLTIANGNFHRNGQFGILLNSGTNHQIIGNMVFSNSTTAKGSYHGIAVGAGVSGFQIVGNVSGQGGFSADSGGSNNQGYGILVSGGNSNSYIIQNNRCPGNVTGVISVCPITP